MNIGISPAILALLTALLFLTQGAHAFRDPETGTFITRDPAGFVDGPNVYGYVRQNPWTKFDPHGLYETGGADPNDRNTPRWFSTKDKDGKFVLKVINGGEELRTDAAVESFNAKQSGDWSKVIARMEKMADLEKSAPGAAMMNYQEVVAGADPEYNAKLNSWADTTAAISPADMVNPNRSPMGAGGKVSPSGTSARDIHKQNTESVAATSSSNAAKTTPEFVNLASPQRTTHILTGDATGGGHLFPGGAGKSAFPQSWSADRVMHEISDVATDPLSSFVTGRGGRTVVNGTRDGIDLRVILGSPREGGGIITGFPTNVPRNP